MCLNAELIRGHGDGLVGGMEWWFEMGWFEMWRVTEMEQGGGDVEGSEDGEKSVERSGWEEWGA